MVTNQTTGRSSISITSQTKQGLDSIKHVGQSYDGLLQEMLTCWKENRSESRPPRKGGKIRTPVYGVVVGKPPL